MLSKMYMPTILLVALCATMVTCVSLGEKQQVLELLDRLLETQKRESQDKLLQRRVNEVVDKVFFFRGEGDLSKRSEGDSCSGGTTATCANELCDQGACEAACDNLKQTPTETYGCKCYTNYVGARCEAASSQVCHDCQDSNHFCYQTDSSLTGYFCYDTADNYNLLNPDAVLEARSLRKLVEMGRFAHVVTQIMRREMTDRNQNID